MEYLPFSFIAGLLTVLSPCVFTLLPVILGTTLDKKGWRRPIIIISSLSVSIIIFTLILKASTALINVPPSTWTYLSGGIILLFGLISLFPDYWDKIAIRLKFSNTSGEFLNKADKQKGVVGDILVGVALGPVFSSCSPTYALIIATVLPQSFGLGLLNLIAYALGIALFLILVVTLGQQAVIKFRWAADPHGWFKRILAILLIVTGLAIITGYDKDIETYLLSKGILNPTNIELELLEDTETTKLNTTNNPQDVTLNVKTPINAPELIGLTNWINSDELRLEDLKGKVVIIDFWTYSCINCIRTLPYLKAWDEKYADQGLVIIGVHAPEFSFERVPENVEKAVNDFEIEYPVALDNDFLTWRTYSNRYWPAKYFIDKNGQIVHTHFGEGAYEESEAIIQYLLGLDVEESTDEVLPPISREQSAETYLGYQRMFGFANNSELVQDQAADYTAQRLDSQGEWTLDGSWMVDEEKISSLEDNNKLIFKFNAKDVYLVMGSDTPKELSITINGELTNLGKDVDTNGKVKVNNFKLYHLVNADEFLFDAELVVTIPQGVQANAFTFGS